MDQRLIKMNNIFEITLLIILFVPIFIMTAFIPYWTRKTESFGISIPEAIYNSERLRSMRKKYSQQIIWLSIITTVLLVALFFIINLSPENLAILYTVLILLYLIISFFVYLKFHRKMKRLKKAEQWFQDKSQTTVVHTKFHYEKLTISNLFYF